MEEAVCRLCLADVDLDDCGYSVADDKFRKALERVFTFNLYFAADDLPVYTCKQCSWNVLDFQSFSERVEKNQEKWRERSLLDEQANDETAGQGDGETSGELAYDDYEDQHESSVTYEFEPSNTPSQDLSCSFQNEEEVGGIHPDHMYSSKADPNANDEQSPVMICEEYLITSDEADASEAYTRTNELLDGEEPPKKKQKNPYHNETDIEKNHLELENRSDSNIVAPLASKMYPCEQCDKLFESKWLVEYHQQEHIVTRCMFCKKHVPLKHINIHMSTHLGDFNCDLCKKKFLNQRECRWHKKVCTGA